MERANLLLKTAIDIIYRWFYGDVRLLKLRPAGMFSNVNEVVQHIHLASNSGYRFVIDWSRSCYRSNERQTDPWAYYFEPCYNLPRAHHRSLKIVPSGPTVACSATNIITPRSIDGSNDSILKFPEEREYVNRLIENHIRVKKDIANEIKKFTEKSFSNFMIGMHIRGIGANDAGRSEARISPKGDIKIPYQRYFAEAQQVLNSQPQAKILVCSDSSLVIDRVIAEFGDRVLTYNAIRTIKGEMHTLRSKVDDSNQEIDPYTLGKDVLIEALLLAQTDYFISGRSNIVNFVLCKNPKLQHFYAERDVDENL
jgi:hypothetical protein